ncbi:hypothetical protein [Actinokineospora terrae]|uniref:Uncharacterized protein n=1 Tax=Actinokineospora terrae TaxID=155974 RepID=A0A1H9VYL9_9PSEU|nr:hypothetical protein [Actinokineospora terrae]SES26856.1 hypothetical protein SAMN04487818_109206 [Actinokineospora terrae]
MDVSLLPQATVDKTPSAGMVALQDITRDIRRIQRERARLVNRLTGGAKALTEANDDPQP